MASSLTLSLLTAQSGLRINQEAMDAAANNIANVNSAGYTRKTISQEQRVVDGTGAGVQLGDLKRQIDEGLLKTLRLETSIFNTFDIQSNYYDRLQFQFGTPADNQSISHVLGDFSGALESMALSPESTLEQSEVLRWADQVTQELKDMSSTIQQLRLEADNAVSDAVAEINRLVLEIRDFNDLLVRNTAIKTGVSDVMDQRDVAMDRLSELIDARYYIRGDGDMVVFTTSGRTLVDNIPSTLTHSPISTSDPTISHDGGSINGIYVGAKISANDITNDIIDGQLKGLIEMRDNVLVDLQSQIDELAGEIRDGTNLIHNRGVAFPGAQTLTGSRNFIDSATQSITISNTTEDVVISVMNATGDQQAVTTLRSIMGAAPPSAFTFNVDAFGTALQTWLRSAAPGGPALTTATASVNTTTEKFEINLNSTTSYIAFRDQTSNVTTGATPGTHQDVTIGFNADADGGNLIDETVSGFSNFFGFNDLFVDGLTDGVWESNVLASTYTVPSGVTLTFEDNAGAMTGSPVTLLAGDSLTSVRDKVNAAMTDVVAEVVSDGSGFRLRFTGGTGSMVVADSLGNAVNSNSYLAAIGMKVADVRVSTVLSLRSDLVNTPARLVRGSLQYDANLGINGEFYVSKGDDSIIEALSKRFTADNVFDSAGSIGGVTLTFAEYGAAILERNASLASNNEQDLKFKESLTDSIKNKSDNIRGVNLDEELANLLIYEQAYSAAARVVSIIQRMFDALEQAVS